MAEFSGTNLEKGKGEEEFFEVEALIKETLEESQLLHKEPVSAPVSTPSHDFQATKIVVPPSPPQPTVVPLPAPTPAKKTEAESVQSRYEATFKEYQVGDIVKGIVLKVDPSGVLVDIKYKADGLILPEELSDHSSTPTEQIVKVGDVIDVLIENLENKEGYAILSKRKADAEKQWNIAYDALKTKRVLEGKVLQVLRGGLVVDCGGVRGFIPASQVSRQPDETLESFKDKQIPVKIIEVNRRQGKVVLSHKLAAGEKQRFTSTKILEELEVGQIRHGSVSSLKTFGAFVDIGGIEGLIHLSELSWKRVKHPSEVLKVGQELDVFVLGVDKVNKKVALGLKELQPDPWAEATDLYKPGQIVKVKILRFAKFGAFVELENGLEGLIHISELSKENIQKPEDAVQIGAVVEAKILRVLPDEQRIGLSIREIQIECERTALKEINPPPTDQKITIGDILAQKEKEKAERDVENIDIGQ